MVVSDIQYINSTILPDGQTVDGVKWHTESGRIAFPDCEAPSGDEMRSASKPKTGFLMQRPD